MVMIGVVGDVAVDWFERNVHAVNLPDHPSKVENYRQQTGFTWHMALGGAWLLASLVEAATKLDGETVSVRGHPRIDGDTATAQNYINSLATIALSGEASAPRLRATAFRGFDGPHEDDTVRLGEWPPGDAVDIVVVDDAGNGARWDLTFQENIATWLGGANNFILKVSQPFLENPLIDLLRSTNCTTTAILNVDDLRDQAVDISRRLSWERTAQDLIKARISGFGERDDAPENERRQGGRCGLTALFEHAHVIVRLNCDGAMIFPRGEVSPTLIFDPTGAEGSFLGSLNGCLPGGTSVFTASIVAALASQPDAFSGPETTAALTVAAQEACARVKAYHKKGITSDGASLRYPMDIFDQSSSDIARAQTFRDVYVDGGPSGKALGVSWSIAADQAASDATFCRNIVLFGRTRGLHGVPTARYRNLLLVDRREIEGYRSIENLLSEYHRLRHRGSKPLSIAVLGPPGAGKSFGIKELSKSVAGAEIYVRTFNLTQFDSPDDLATAFHFARDVTLSGGLPLLIFDEFDCTVGGREFGWLKSFLGPMQDGEFKEGSETHPIGPAIFVFAGGICHTFDDLRKKIEEHAEAKVRDFVSRLRGHLDVLGINSHLQKGGGEAGVDPNMRARRAVLLRALLLADLPRTGGMFPIIDGKRYFQIDKKVLDAFLDVEFFEHGARSLEAILGMSQLASAERFTISRLPPDILLLEHVPQSFIDILHRANTSVG